MNEEIKKLLKDIKECDSLHNNCDYLLEHNDCDLLGEYIENLQQENQQQKEVIKEIREYIEKETIYNNYNEVYRGILDSRNVNHLLQILDKYKN